MSVHMIEAKFLLLEVCTTTLSPSIYHIKSVHITEAKFLLRKVYYYIETQYLTPWCQYIWLRQSFYCWSSVLLHWVPVSDTWSKYTSRGQASTAKGQYDYNESKYLTNEVSTHHWDQDYTARSSVLLHTVPESDTMMSVHMTEAKFLMLKVSITTLCQNIWHMKSVHITEPSSTAWGQNYYIESQYLTPSCEYTWLRQSFYCRRSILLHWVPVSDNEVSTYS